MSTTADYRDILHNRLVLYIIFFIALINVFVLTTLGDWTYVSIFFLVGFLTSFFSKNMVVILFFAITVTNILKYGSAAGVSRGSLEGFDEGLDKGSDEKKSVVDASGNVPAKMGTADTVAAKPAPAPVSKDSSSSYTKEDIAARKELVALQTDLLDKIKTMEPFFEKMSTLKEKMTTKR
jgi:hypothetical protein